MCAVSSALLYSLASSAFAPNFRSDASIWSSKLRRDVLARDELDIDVPPTSDRAASATAELGHYSDAGTDVALTIRFFKVENVRPAEASMRLKVWVRMSWIDLRLAWNESAYGGLSETTYRVDGDPTGEVSQIWAPDLQPYNAITGFVGTLEPSFAKVQSNGRVFWSRPGSLEVLCKFSGLVAFPFDRLVCKVEIAGWLWGGGQQGLGLDGKGFELSDQEVTSGASYQEVSIANVSVRMMAVRPHSVSNRSLAALPPVPLLVLTRRCSAATPLTAVHL